MQSLTDSGSPSTSTFALVIRLARGYVRPYVGRLLLSLVFMAIVAAATAANAWLMQPVLDDVFLRHDQTMLYLVPIALIAVAAIKGGADYGQAVLINRVGLRVIADLQAEMFAHLMRADLAFFHGNSTGSLISRFTNDVNLLRAAVSNALLGMVKDSFTVVFLVALMFYRDWILASIAFVVFPLTIVPILRLGRRMRRVSTNTLVEIGHLATLLTQTFQGARHVKAYGMESYEVGRAGGIINGIFKLTYKAVRVRALNRPVMEILASSAIAAVIYYGGSQVIHGKTTPGTFFSFITALLLAYQPVKSLGSLSSYLEEGMAAAQRIFAMLDIEAEIRDKPGAKPLRITGGEIRVDNVVFSYKPDVTALNGVSLTVPAGRTAALVGPSGGGKSTILNLIPRFYDVDSGRVLVDGMDVRDVTLASLRGAIALVSQEISLFDDTVRANIAYGRWGCSEEEIIKAAKRAAAHDFILSLPEGYDTMVGEHGIKLSGGQRQRLAIARAMIKNAPILLLDEATSSLDTESERQVQTALTELMKGRTTLVIAHRLSTIMSADIIYVIEGGRVSESGTHSELLARKGTYARLHGLQFADPAALAQELPAIQATGS